jgi:hypothetical protein
MRAMCAVSLVVATTLALGVGVVPVSVRTTEHAALRHSVVTPVLSIGHGVGPSYFVIGRASIAMSRCSTHVVSHSLLHMQTTSSPSVMVVLASTSRTDALAVTSVTHAKRSMRSARAVQRETGAHVVRARWKLSREGVREMAPCGSPTRATERGGGCRIFQAPPLYKTAQHLDFVAYRIREN